MVMKIKSRYNRCPSTHNYNYASPKSRTQVFFLKLTPTKNIIEDLTRSVQISQEMVRSSYQIYLIRTQVKNLTYLLYRIIRISKIRSDQDSEQINSDLSGTIFSKENRLSKITLYRSYQDSEQINSDLSGTICSKENRLSKITLYRSYQDSEQIN